MTDRPAIEFGIHLPLGWRSEFAPITDPVEQFQVTVDIARLAESLGYDSIWVGDHFHTIPGADNTSLFESWTTLAAVSQHTERVQLGHMVGCAAFRQPSLVAKMGATLDVMSRGRFIWGIGAGWHEDEFVGYGIPFGQTRDRLQILRETVEIVKLMWTEEAPSYEGKFFQIDGARCDPKPIQKLPQIVIGASGEKIGVPLVAEHATRCNFVGAVETVESKLTALRARCADIGRDENEIMKSWTGELFIRETEDEIIDGGVRSLIPVPIEIWRVLGVVGTPEQACAHIQRMLDLGITGLTFSPCDFPDQETMRLFAEKVMPEFR